jgi:hypothetical protein
MSPAIKTLLVAATALAVAACASAPFKTTWRAPQESSFAITGQKMVAIYASDVKADGKGRADLLNGFTSFPNYVSKSLMEIIF